MKRALLAALLVALAAIPTAGGVVRTDYAGVALNVLPPPQSGDLLFPPTAKDQLRLYDGLTGRKLAAQQGTDPTRWREDATGERITFGFLPLTARWTNRPTFQQVVTFDGHRPR